MICLYVRLLGCFEYDEMDHIMKLYYGFLMELLLIAMLMSIVTCTNPTNMRELVIYFNFSNILTFLIF